MELSKREELNNLFDIQAGNISVSPTRAVVVSNRDPLFLGRVKVWIPTIHGLTLGNDTKDTDTEKEPPLPEGGCDPGVVFSDDELSKKVQNFILPWAKCLGHNWGPRYETTEKGLVSGLFSVPKVGTEVFVIFEDDDFNHPLVIGSIMHAGEFVYKPNRYIELFPGTLVDNESVNDLEADYTNRSANSYSIRAENGSMLFISDDSKASCLLLSGMIKPKDSNMMDSETYSSYTKAYPGFPTTASAPYSIRESIQSDIILNRTKENIDSATIESESDTSVNGEGASSVTGLDQSNLTNTKVWPVKPAKGQAVPTFSGAGGRFGAPRANYKNSEKRHIGLDIAVGAGTELVAPVDMIPVWSDFSGAAGLRLFCISVNDKTGHGFFHLQEIDSYVKGLLKSRISTVLKAGTKLGTTGKSGTYGGTYGHLHWEIYRGGDILIRTSEELLRMRSRATSIGTSACIDPIKWMSEAVNTNLSIDIISEKPTNHAMGVEQTASYLSHRNFYLSMPDDVEKAKPIGLEIVTVPGKECIFLRHSSGSYLGFDHDGNYVVYTCGDANIKVNRSWNLDVFGGILESCHARFTRVKTAVKTWANHWNNLRDKLVADDSYPIFFRRAQLQRELDINDATRSKLNNAYFVMTNSDNSVDIAPLLEVMPNTDVYITPAVTTPKKFNDATYDTLIETMYNAFIKPNTTLYKTFTSWKLFKAQMLKESDADKLAVSGKEAFGLFQIRATAAKDVWGYDMEMTQFFDPELNVTTGIKYMVKCYNYIATYINQRDKKYGITTEVSPESMQYMSFLCFNVGPTSLGKILLSFDDPKLSYNKVEAAYKAAHPAATQAISYVPTIRWIYGKLP